MMRNLKKNLVFFTILIVLLGAFLSSFGKSAEHIIGADIDYPPFSSILSDGMPAGLDIDITDRIFKTLNLPYSLKLDTWDKILRSLINGEIDAVVGILYTTSRSKVLDFSLPYCTDTIAIFVRKNSNIQSVNDLQNKELAILKDDAITESFVQANGLLVKSIRFATFRLALEALNSGSHNFCLAPYSVGMQIIKSEGLRNLKVTGPAVNTVQYRFAVKKGRAILLEQLNRAIDQMRISDGDLELRNKWLKYTREELTFKVLAKYFAIFIVPMLILLLAAWIIFLKKEVRRQTEKIVKYSEELEKLATTDSLTGIHNRRYFYGLGLKEFDKAKRNNLDLSILMMDIDNFKKINDTYGHDAGDAVLKSLATKCASIVRSFDLFARFGGEEFIMLLPNTSLGDCLLSAERIRSILSSEKVVINEKEGISFTVSVGISSISTADASLEEIIKRADQGLYLAKNKSKNTVVEII